MFDSKITAEKIREILEKEFSPHQLEIEDQSYMHKGHRQAGGGGHFFVEIHSAKFQGITPLARQRLVIEAVGEMMDREIHALSMKCVPVTG
jgi:BolA family transcriptional regulator, general stress-responsive regulator